MIAIKYNDQLGMKKIPNDVILKGKGKEIGEKQGLRKRWMK